MCLWKGTKSLKSSAKSLNDGLLILGALACAGAVVAHDLNVDGSLHSANVDFGCCTLYRVTEELAQILGPIADSADARSIFSLERTQLTPSASDAWVDRGLYRVNPGARPEELAEALNAERGPQQSSTLEC
jgi:hypothetical protein